jgi:hypothetical protein
MDIFAGCPSSRSSTIHDRLLRYYRRSRKYVERGTQKRKISGHCSLLVYDIIVTSRNSRGTFRQWSSSSYVKICLFGLAWVYEFLDVKTVLSYASLGLAWALEDWLGPL